ncbi:MAG: HAMP domain-containing protein [Rhodospirillaceae bacterium]
MPIDRMNAVMQVAAGLGKTGESAIVGSDFLLRSDLRNVKESTIFKAKMEGPGVKSALAGKAGVVLADGKLTAFTPLEFQGAKWVVIAEADHSEVQAPVRDLLKAAAVAAVLIGPGVAVLGWLVARSIVAPVNRMTAAMAGLADGNLEIEVPEKDRGDELGDMAATVDMFKQNAFENRCLEEATKAAEARAAADMQKSADTMVTSA